MKGFFPPNWIYDIIINRANESRVNGEMDINKNEAIVVRGANCHNLKNVSVSIPKNQLVVFTGVSGSGKSSLAFDTIFAEGQRRYVESLSAYARQFLGQLDKPDVESIEGLSPAISIDQKSTNNNPRSTVGTVTEIYDHLRLLFARIGTPHCPECGKEIKPQTLDQIVNNILRLDEGTKIQILSPLIRGRKGEYAGLFNELRDDKIKVALYKSATSIFLQPIVLIFICLVFGSCRLPLKHLN